MTKKDVTSPPNSFKETLIQRYKTTFIDKLTRKDLKELQGYLEKELDSGGKINEEFRHKFEEKLRQYFHESVLEREIVTIEALVKRLSPKDLKR
jgi:tRNA C32,U32 (ribose-2'-O)-methylase TrmJ